MLDVNQLFFGETCCKTIWKSYCHTQNVWGHEKSCHFFRFSVLLVVQVWDIAILGILPFGVPVQSSSL